MRRWLRDAVGAELSETAITLPVMLLVLFGMVNLGYMAYEAQVAQAAARHGARMASVAQTQGGQVAIAQNEAARLAREALGSHFGGVGVEPAGVGSAVKVTVYATVPNWLGGFGVVLPDQVKGVALFRAEGW